MTFKEYLKKNTFKDILGGYADDMDLKQCLETKKIIDKHSGKVFLLCAPWALLAVLCGAVYNFAVEVLASWGIGEVLEHDTTPLVFLFMALTLLAIAYGYVVAVSRITDQINKRIKIIAGVDDGQKETRAD